MTSAARIDCVVAGTCVADILVRPVPLTGPVGGGRLFHVDPIEVTTGGIVCNTGIGLARLGLVAGLVGGMPPREACLLGAAHAACCVTAAGATAGLRSFAVTLALSQTQFTSGPVK